MNNESKIDPKLKKFVKKKSHYGAFNDFIDLLDTPTSYTKPGDLVVINDDNHGLVFKDPIDILGNLIGDFLNVKTYKYNFTNTDYFIINHGMNTKYIIYKIFDEDGYEFLPGEFHIIDMNKIEVHLSHVTTGWIVLLGLMF
jgi:hypothetical protein